MPLAIVLVIAYAIAFLIDEPLRRYTEAKMNRALKGYTVRIKKLDFHPHGFSLDLKGLTLVQDAHPDPAVADIPYLHASVNWKALLHGRVVGDMLIDRPKVYMNLVQLRKEIADPTRTCGSHCGLSHGKTETREQQHRVVGCERSNCRQGAPNQHTGRQQLFSAPTVRQST